MGSIESRVKADVVAIIRESYDIQLDDVVIETPPHPQYGDMALPVAFDLAKRIGKVTGEKQQPRKLAESIVAGMETGEGISKIEIAGPGYINVFLDRAEYLFSLARPGVQPPRAPGKVIVEHTSINPNKAAHIGHLRNAVLGDCLVQLLRATGQRVEAHNYIDNTGVQVADVVVGFLFLEKMTLEQIEAITGKFDYYCWDLYARVTDWYRQDPNHLEKRRQTLKEIEIEGHPTSLIADSVSTRILNCHLDTLERLGIHYDLLPRESDILHLRFWDLAFDILKQSGAIVYETEGRNAGCWVMKAETRLEAEDLGQRASDSCESGDAGERDPQPGNQDHEADKILVRSDGTVNYTGKDIAYHLWKLGKLGVDFWYRPFRVYPDSSEVWITTSDAGAPTRETRPIFGFGSSYLNVIGSEQAYLQNFVREAIATVAPDIDITRSAHVSYEKVSLSPEACRALGIELTADEMRRQQISMSGRRGLGVKADDLIDTLEERALEEVGARHEDLPREDHLNLARKIAVGALRYFLLKFTRSTAITFDFGEALSFEGETGPYLQYTVVRANSIFRKIDQAGVPRCAIQEAPRDKLLELLSGETGDELWSMTYLAGRLDRVIQQACENLEPSFVAKVAFQLAQQFNIFYHTHHILREPDETRQLLLITMTEIVERQLRRALALLGIDVPERM